MNKHLLVVICSIVYISTIVTSDIDISYPHDPVKGLCNSGEYLYKKGNHKCCKLCPPGEFADARCNDSINTKCKKCPEYTYTSIPNYSTGCHQCRKCPNGAFEKIRCNGTHNSKCECLPGWFCVVDPSTMPSGECPVCIPKRKCPCGYFGGINKLGEPLCKSCCVSDFCRHIHNHRNTLFY
ncbi:TNF receptor [NY_014 poxvirus]|uniref:TNF receptor n=1 Tax=NY_014 poxvirus TaxID=2025360 RepID=UPI000B9A0451|nr:TNF receptor [NY_014 poxvirus]AST09409.1 TNF receptor [NY_014 poxvirus]